MDPYLCPTCGADDWVAEYMVPAEQPVTVVLGDDGLVPWVDVYAGGERLFDAGPDEALTCQACGHRIELLDEYNCTLDAPKHTPPENFKKDPA